MRHAGEECLSDHVVERLEGQIRVDRARAVADAAGRSGALRALRRIRRRGRTVVRRARAHQVVVHAAVASRLGIGAIVRSTPRSDRIRTLYPSSMAVGASTHSASSARSRPVARLRREQHGSVTRPEPRSVEWRVSPAPRCRGSGLQHDLAAAPGSGREGCPRARSWTPSR